MQDQDHAEMAALTTTGVGRRNLLLGAGVAVTTLALSEGASFATSLSGHGAVVDSTLECVKAGQACTNHCLELFKTGDTSMADCAAAVQQMHVICGAMSHLASLKSSFVPALARVCAEICRTCETECLKMAHIPVCKACGEAAKHCAKECEKVAA